MESTSTSWQKDGIRLKRSTETWDTAKGEMEVHASEEITAPPERWLDAAVSVIAMLPGKRTADDAEFILGPADADPEMIGALVAAKLRELAERNQL